MFVCENSFSHISFVDGNYEISYNNIDLLEQIKKYKKRTREIRQELIEERYKNEIK